MTDGGLSNYITSASHYQRPKSLDTSGAFGQSGAPSIPFGGYLRLILLVPPLTVLYPIVGIYEAFAKFFRLSNAANTGENPLMLAASIGGRFD